MSVSDQPSHEDEMTLRYKQAVERAIAHLPAKNGVVHIDAIWVDTSLPFNLLREILARDDLELPEHVERIDTKSRVKAGEQSESQPEKKGRRRRRRRR
jgi:hypothetical protein